MRTRSLQLPIQHCWRVQHALSGGAKEQSERLLVQSSELIESWLGSLSPGIQVVSLIRGAGMLIAGEWASGYSLEAAEAAPWLKRLPEMDQRAEACADVAGQASWLLHLSGHCNAAGDVACSRPPAPESMAWTEECRIESCRCPRQGCGSAAPCKRLSQAG